MGENGLNSYQTHMHLCIVECKTEDLIIITKTINLTNLPFNHFHHFQQFQQFDY